MRKIKKLLGVLLGCIIICIISSSIESFASDDVKALKQKWYDTRYYPITSASEEWSNYSGHDCIDILNPPGELLFDMSTEQLASLVIDYPYSRNPWMYSSEEQYYRFLLHKCDIFAEWISRDDAFDALLDVFDTHSIDCNGLNDEYKTQEISGANSELFINRTVRFYWDNLSLGQQKRYMDILKSKENLYHQIKPVALHDMLCYYLEFEDFFRSDSFDRITHQDVQSRSEGFSSYGYTFSVPYPSLGENVYYYDGQYSKYNTTANCYMYYSNDFSNNTKNLINSMISNDNPSWTFISSSTAKYNCHSYAWISASTSNIYWLNNPENFSGSNSFSFINTNGSVQAGDKVVIYSYDDYGNIAPAHSVIVNIGGYYLTPIYVTSKLGTAGLYTSTLSDMMDFYDGIFYKVYR